MSDRMPDAIHGEPERDLRLAAALRLTESRLSELGAERLRARIAAAAAPKLAELRSAQQPWWEWAARWGRVAAPIGLAACLAAGLLIARTEASELTGGALEVDSTLAAERSVVLTAAATGASHEQVANQFVIPASQDALLGAAMSR
jgi:hypothetical protein